MFGSMELHAQVVKEEGSTSLENGRKEKRNYDNSGYDPLREDAWEVKKKKKIRKWLPF